MTHCNFALPRKHLLQKKTQHKRCKKVLKCPKMSARLISSQELKRIRVMEILKVKNQLQMSDREIVNSVGVTRSTVARNKKKIFTNR